MIRLFRTALIALACMAAPLVAAADDSFVWQITDADNTVYLAGSIHLLPPDAYPLPQPFQDAFADSEIVAFETNIQRLRSSEVRTRLYRAARYDQGGLAAHLDDRTYSKLSHVLEDLGLSMSAMRVFRPWFVAGAIELSAFRAAGFEEELGVDVHFYDQAREQGKTILALEEVSKHLQLLSKMPLEMQLGYLRTTIEDMPRLKAAPAAIYRFWRRGNAEGLAAYVHDSIKAEPALFQRILFDRNHQWMGVIERLIAGNRDAMIIVGALHLVGERSLIRLLEQQGYAVQRP